MKKVFIPMLAMLWASFSCALRGEVRLPAIFSEHAVLMRSAAVPVWGKADPSEAVTVTLAGQSAQGKAGEDGKWSASLNLKDAAAGPFEMVVQGKNKIIVPDVVIGAVWLASGQSNMERLLSLTANADQEIAGSSNAMLRQFHVEKKVSETPAEDCKGKWVLAAPGTSGDFTAVGYYFGKQLHEKLHVPVGIINSSWGGTYSEAWTSMDAMNQNKDLREGEATRRKIIAEYPKKKQAYVAGFTQWLKDNGREDKPSTLEQDESFAAETISTDDWKKITLPGKIAANGLPGTGVVWIRREVNVPANVLTGGYEFKVLLGQMDGFERVYWNGKKVDETTYQRLPGANYTRYFKVPSDVVRPGRNVITVRIYAPTLPVKIIAASDRFWAGPIDLCGEWLAKGEYALPELLADKLASVPQCPTQPPAMKAGAIFNGMISPLVPYAIDGVIWYQGESNTGRAWQYREAFPLLIEDWRAHWKQKDLPFYFCQLANFLAKADQPGEGAYSELRDSQSAALHLPHTGQAVLIDLGESVDIHPRNKRDVGLRLARIALAHDYGKEVVWSGPVFESAKIEGDAIRVKFSHAEGGLVAKPLPATYDVSTLMGKTAPLVRNSPHSELEGFAICGADHHWVWADAKIDGDTVVVSSEKVPQPIAVRYAWAENPTCNLSNGAELPASPFRTDDFPLTTAKQKYGPGS